ncbi:MAG: indole-3-glycerol phosphate synthase TrpC [Phycisphaerae bacterium]|nr:indole-3-glycerol phosphate synthase TrpC [Phycisphaerae bacterium]
MSDILNTILKVKKEEVQQDRLKITTEALKSQIRDLPPCLDFYQAITKHNARGINVIAEIKRASPSAGLIRQDFDPESLAHIYQNAGADAISVLTDQQFFQGSLDFIRQVKQAVKLPVLRKDFIIDPYQVYQARAAGADAILLIAEALTLTQIIELLSLADSLTLTVLLEIHEKSSLLQVLPLLESPGNHKFLLGINNRNLKTMQVDLGHSESLSTLIKDKRILVSESGIKTRADVKRLIHAGFHGVLIGETLMKSKNIKARFNDLFGSPPPQPINNHHASN